MQIYREACATDEHLMCFLPSADRLIDMIMNSIFSIQSTTIGERHWKLSKVAPFPQRCGGLQLHSTQVHTLISTIWHHREQELSVCTCPPIHLIWTLSKPMTGSTPHQNAPVCSDVLSFRSVSACF